MRRFLDFDSLMIGVCCAGRHVFHAVLRSHLDSDVPDHWHLGVTEQDLRSFVLLYTPLAADAGCADLPVLTSQAQFRHPGGTNVSATQTPLFTFPGFAVVCSDVPWCTPGCQTSAHVEAAHWWFRRWRRSCSLVLTAFAVSRSSRCFLRVAWLMTSFADCRDLWPGGAGTARHEETVRSTQWHGFRDVWFFPVQRPERSAVACPV
jgi:hypothetical protein